MESITIALADDLTLGELRGIARQLGKRLVITLQSDGRPVARRVGVAQSAPASAPTSKQRRRRGRKLSPEARAAVAKNLEKARAAQAAKRAAGPKRGRKGTSTGT